MSPPTREVGWRLDRDRLEGDDDGRRVTMASNATVRKTTLAAALSKMQSPDKGTR
jgi:hypothetical protein